MDIDAVQKQMRNLATIVETDLWWLVTVEVLRNESNTDSDESRMNVSEQ